MSLTATSLQSALKNLPPCASEALVSGFVYSLLTDLGFQSPQEVYPEYPTGAGNHKVDKAARKTIGDDIFLYTKSNPYLLVEVKGREVNLSADSAQYHRTVKQLKQYLLEPNCKSAQWGIITNSCHIQLFRKHDKVVFPATHCIPINEGNVDDVVASIRQKIEKPTKALTVAVYNNKGGVGKTTTTVNLAAILAFMGKKVLAIDFDPNQQDLTNYLGLSVSKDSVFNALTKKDGDLQSVIHTYRFPLKGGKSELKFDVIPADLQLADQPEQLLRNHFNWNTLYRKLEAVRQEYDYILIDAPPNWRIFSHQAVYASDVVLFPTKHNNIFSLENAATAMKKFIPEVQKLKEDGTPTPLPIFFNGERITDPQLRVAQDAIASILKTAKSEGFDLMPYFFPRLTKAKKDLHIPEVPSYANIAAAAFSRAPAVYRNRSAHEYYKNLAKEYFLQ